MSGQYPVFFTSSKTSRATGNIFPEHVRVYTARVMLLWPSL